MKIAVAHAAGDGAHDYFALFGLVDIDLLDGEWLTGTVEDSSFHLDCSLISIFVLRDAIQLNIRTVRATSPAFIARNASLTSSSLPRRLIISSSLRRPCR